MSKNTNTEIIIEIMSDNTEKLQKITKEQVNLVQEFSSAVDRASKLEIEPKTERLLEIIAHWNQLFTAQKNQIQELQNNKNNENKKQRLGIYIMLFLAIIILLSVLLILIFKKI
jgi:hypothetical protein